VFFKLNVNKKRLDRSFDPLSSPSAVSVISQVMADSIRSLLLVSVVIVATVLEVLVVVCRLTWQPSF
jgi:hypothetical protein